MSEGSALTPRDERAVTDNGWQPIETAPMDGAPFQARIPGHGEDNIIAWIGGIEDDNGDIGGAWSFVEDQEPPDCWTDGICWRVNADGVASVQPTAWKPLEALSKDRGEATTTQQGGDQTC
jgi:hypothetical protein